MLTQIPGGYVTSRVGGRRVLPFGVGLWSAATAAVPFLAGTMPGAPRPASCRLSPLTLGGLATRVPVTRQDGMVQAGTYDVAWPVDSCSLLC